MRDAFSPRGQRSETEALALLTAVDLLVLDEVGVAIGNAVTRRAMLFDVLNARYGEMHPTILIGNLTAAEMEAYLGERIMDRLLELGSEHRIPVRLGHPGEATSPLTSPVPVPTSKYQDPFFTANASMACRRGGPG